MSKSWKIALRAITKKVIGRLGLNCKHYKDVIYLIELRQEPRMFIANIISLEHHTLFFNFVKPHAERRNKSKAHCPFSVSLFPKT